MDDDDFVTQYVTNIDPSDEPQQPAGCWGVFMAVVGIVAMVLVSLLLL